MVYRLGLAWACAAAVASVLLTAQQRVAQTALRIDVIADPVLKLTPTDGRLFVVLGKTARPEPRTTIGRTGMDAAPVLAVDVTAFDGKRPGVIDGRSVAFPVASLAEVPPGDYVAQAVLDTNIDLKSVNAPGNLYSDPTTVRIDPSAGGVVRLTLSSRVPNESLPSSTDILRFVKIQSKLLSAFHGRPMYLRAGVVLPRGFDQEPARKYPLRVHIGGYGFRYTAVQRLAQDGSEFRKTWFSDAAPRMVMVHLDGDGPLGDPYQVNSANHGPFGDAITQELIPYLEREFRAVGNPRARVLDGGSTGGWVSLALQIFYPDFFNGVWSSCPDGVDFRGFQLVNIYEDANAYVNKNGFERPSSRELNGDVKFTMRHELQLENVLGRGNSWTMSGEQWGAWNATYGPKGADRRPVPLWDAVTGAIDHRVAERWKPYDLRLYLEEHWNELAPKLAGKIHIAIGDADDYFLNNAARMLEAFFKKAQPQYQGRMVFAPMQGHCYTGLTELEMLQEMSARVSDR